MKHNVNVLANTFALAAAVLWLICSAFVMLLPEFSLTVARWWLHGMQVPQWSLDFSNFLLGGITITLSAWVTGYVFGWSWEKVSKK